MVCRTRKVRLVATDIDGPGDIAATYSVDGGSAVAYSSPFTVSSDGTHALAFHGVDVAGNVEPLTIVTFKLDKTPPTVAVTIPSTATLTNQRLLVASANDAVSGVTSAVPT